MAELADALDLGSSAARRAGSTPASRSAPSSNKKDHLIIEGSSQTVTVAIDRHVVTPAAVITSERTDPRLRAPASSAPRHG